MRCDLVVHYIHTWQAGTTLHSICFLSITQLADVEAQRFDVIDTFSHHQILLHQVAAIRARLGQRGHTVKIHKIAGNYFKKRKQLGCENHEWP